MLVFRLGNSRYPANDGRGASLYGGRWNYKETAVASEVHVALSRGATVEAGVNLAREDAYRRMRSRRDIERPYRAWRCSPHVSGFNRPDVYVIDDWR